MKPVKRLQTSNYAKIESDAGAMLPLGTTYRVEQTTRGAVLVVGDTTYNVMKGMPRFYLHNGYVFVNGNVTLNSAFIAPIEEPSIIEVYAATVAACSSVKELESINAAVDFGSLDADTVKAITEIYDRAVARLMLAKEAEQRMDVLSTLEHPHRQTVISRAIEKDIKITDEQVAASRTLREVAVDFVSTYKGKNTFIQDIAVKFTKYGSLTTAQMRGALNVMVAEARAARMAPVPKPEPIRHIVPNGTYTVQINDSGEYRALRLSDCLDSFAKAPGTQLASYQAGPDNNTDFVGFAFVAGDTFITWKRFVNARELAFALTKLLTTGRHGEFGKIWAMKAGECFICGRKLTVPISKKAGIGPVCAMNNGIDIQALAALDIENAQETARATALAEMEELF